MQLNEYIRALALETSTIRGLAKMIIGFGALPYTQTEVETLLSAAFIVIGALGAFLKDSHGWK